MPEWVDIRVGERIRELRKSRGFSQGELGDLIGVSFQQVQKYETGRNRVGASRLWEISKVLEAQIEYFFEGLAMQSPGDVHTLDSDSLSIAREIRAIPDKLVQKKILALIKVIANTSA